LQFVSDKPRSVYTTKCKVADHSSQLLARTLLLPLPINSRFSRRTWISQFPTCPPSVPEENVWGLVEWDCFVGQLSYLPPTTSVKATKGKKH